MCEVSIIVPFYNVESYFEEFLDSLLPINNSFEVLLVDDGSLDSSRKIAEEFLEKNANARLVTQKNRGLSAARNYGFSQSKGEYVIFFDSDDYVENKRVIDKMYAHAKLTNSDVVLATYYEFENISKRKYRYDKVNIKDELISLEDRLVPFFSNALSFAVWNKLYKRSFLVDNQLTFKEGIWFEDLDFVFRVFFFAQKITKINEVLIGYRQRPGSIMKSISPKILDKIKVLEELFIFLKDKGLLDDFYEGFKILYLRMAFSVIYSIVQNSRNIKEGRIIMNSVFESLLFKRFIAEDLLEKRFLSKSERIFYFLIKYGVVNSKSVFFAKILR